MKKHPILFMFLWTITFIIMVALPDEIRTLDPVWFRKLYRFNGMGINFVQLIMYVIWAIPIFEMAGNPSPVRVRYNLALSVFNCFVSAAFCLWAYQVYI